MNNVTVLAALKQMQMAALDRDGVIKIVGFLPTNTIDLCSKMTDELFRMAPNLPLPLPQTFLEWGGLELERVGEFIASDSFYEIIAELTLFVHDVIGQGWEPRLEKSFFRRLERADNMVPWHIDLEAVSTAALGKRCVNLWVPLSQVGKDSPSMDFVLRSNHLSVPAASFNVETQARHRDNTSVDNTLGERWTPRLEPGDALIFDERTLHRTQKMTKFRPRTTLELRFALPGERQA